MSQPVIIKSNRYGINLILSEELPFSELIVKIEEKFVESEKFFHDATMALAFEGRVLNKEEECQIVDVISRKTSIRIVCIIDEDEEHEKFMKSKLEAAMHDTMANAGDFYKGTLRSGQLLESQNGVIILGDVNPGANIVSEGNIVVLGALKGNAHAGSSGNTGCFVAALEMDPVQIQISDVIGRSADRDLISSLRVRKKAATEPQVAIVSEGHILIEPITKNILSKL